MNQWDSVQLREFTLWTFTIRNSYKHRWSLEHFIKFNGFSLSFNQIFFLLWIFSFFFYFFGFFFCLWQISWTIQSEADVCLNALAQRRRSNVYDWCSCFTESTKDLMKDFADKVKKNKVFSKWHCNKCIFAFFSP